MAKDYFKLTVLKICFYGTRRRNGKRCFYLPLKNASFWLMAFQNGRVNTCFCAGSFPCEEKTNNILPIQNICTKKTKKYPQKIKKTVYNLSSRTNSLGVRRNFCFVEFF